MKTIITTLLAVFGLAFTSYSQNNSSVEIFSENGERFYLILNGVRQNDNPQTNIYIDGLTSSYYHAKVIFENPAITPTEDKNFRTIDDGAFGKYTYVVKQNKKGEYKIRYRDFVAAARAPIPPATQVVHYHSTPNPNTGVVVTETTTTTVGQPTGDNLNVGMNIGGVNFGMNVNVNDAQVQSSSTTTTTVSSSSTYNPGTNYSEPVYTSPAPIPGYSGRIGCNGYPMNQNSFSSAIHSVQSKDFDNTKLSQAKQIASSNCLTANQVKQMTASFDFENSALEFAKYAYAFTIDIDNYFVVGDVFEFESNVTELNNYIQNR